MESKIIAMAGKGGVGKTSLAASMVKVPSRIFSWSLAVRGRCGDYH